jgi:CheY-like chemotaxis protein
MMRRRAEAGTAYDVALLDLLMPGGDGLELAEQVRADPGLAQTHCLILTSGGDLDVARARQAGVGEWISKPVRPAELAEALLRLVGRSVPGPPPAGADEPVRAQEGRRATVLVAEDNMVNQMVAMGFLEELGYDAHLAADGREALALLELGDYDAVLMDCHMPEMDGFQATRELRLRERAGRHTPVIAMTAGVLDEDRERCLAAGMDDFVAKPVDLGDLRDTLARWVGERA